jgi:hypothetical protein
MLPEGRSGAYLSQVSNGSPDKESVFQEDFLIAAWAAARRAIGTRKGEQLT